MMRYALTAAAAMAGLLSAQAATGQGIVRRCPAGQVPVVSLGISGIECSNCTLFDSDDPRRTRWEFRSEPVILSVDPDGPAAGKLREGDVVVSIDGYLATTQEGGRRIARPEAGGPAEFRVRRNGREVDVSVTPRAQCKAVPAPPAPAAEPAPSARARIVAPPEPTRRIDSVRVAPGRVAVFPSPDVPVGIPGLLPTGRLGLSFSCSRCGVEIVADSLRVWSFPEPPVVTAVEPDGPAMRAGIRVGDRIVSVGGEPVTSSAGGQRFGAIRPGEAVALGIRRDGAERTVRLTTSERRVVRAPEPRGIMRTRPVQPETVRYSGRLGDTMINVTGAPVVVTETETEIIIRSGDVTVRLRRDTGRIR